MTTTISIGGQYIAPDLVTDIQTSVDVPTVVHRIIGRSDPDITLQAAQLRAGTLEMLFPDGYAAASAVIALSYPGVATLVDTDVTSIGMSFVVTGAMSTGMDTQDTRRWRVTVPYQEVAP